MNTTYFLNLIAGNVFNTQTLPALPKKYYIGLSLTQPMVDGSGVTEPTASEYERVEITNFSTPSNGVVQTTGTVSFPESLSSWGIVSHYVIFDAQTEGNLLWFCALDSPKSIETDTLTTFRSGEIKLVLENRA